MSVAESVVWVVYTIFAFLCNLLGPSFFDAAHVFRFYKFPFGYTSREDGIVWVFIFAFVVMVPASRRALEKFEQRSQSRVVPSSNP
jgi:hypothetical protein